MAHLCDKEIYREIQTQGYDRLVTLQPVEQAVAVQLFKRQFVDVASRRVCGGGAPRHFQLPTNQDTCPLSC